VLVATALLLALAVLGLKTLVQVRTRRLPVAAGPETMIGTRADVISTCCPDGTVRLRSERWKASCPGGAEIGDTVVVERIDQLTLIVTPVSARA
jgi:membrane protein implicated in regulation of membrane protease activity